MADIDSGPEEDFEGQAYTRVAQTKKLLELLGCDVVESSPGTEFYPRVCSLTNQLVQARDRRGLIKKWEDTRLETRQNGEYLLNCLEEIRQELANKGEGPR